MIDDKTKARFLKELTKNGNVFWACRHINIDRSTYYRWKHLDKNFSKTAGTAIRYGRENNSDIGEIALLSKAKTGDMVAIKYLLSHNSPRYKSKVADMSFTYKKDPSFFPPPPEEKNMPTKIKLEIVGGRNQPEASSDYPPEGAREN